MARAGTFYEIIYSAISGKFSISRAGEGDGSVLAGEIAEGSVCCGRCAGATGASTDERPRGVQNGIIVISAGRRCRTSGVSKASNHRNRKNLFMTAAIVIPGFLAGNRRSCAAALSRRKNRDRCYVIRAVFQISDTLLGRGVHGETKRGNEDHSEKDKRKC